MITWTFDAIGTRWTIDILEEVSNTRGEQLSARIRARIDAYDQTYSRFRDDSRIMYAGTHPGVHEFPEDSAPLFTLYNELYVHTDGLMTPIIGDVLDAAGYDRTYSLREKDTLAPARPWGEVASYAPYTLTTRAHTIIDVGAMGKGQLIDLVSEIIEEEGIMTYVVEAGGDMRVRHPAQGPALRIGLEDPFDTTSVIGVVELTRGSICGSAGNRRAWGRFHHIMNPRTCTPAATCAAVWVVAETTMLADALTTALSFTAPEVLREQYVFSYAILYPDRSLVYAPDFPGTFFM